jgi:hypothetical protein
MINPFALLAAAPLMFANARSSSLDQWPAQGLQEPSGTVRSVNVDIVRGHVRRKISDGPVRAVVQLRSGRPSDVQIEISQVDGGLAIRDIYQPAPIAAAKECLPDAGDRGAFWNSDVILDVTVSAPAPLVVRQHVMDERPIMRSGEHAATPDAAQE